MSAFGFPRRKQYTLDDKGKLVFKKGVVTIEQVEKDDWPKIKKVVINQGAKVIERYALCRCEELTAVSLPSTVVKIGKLSFMGCKKLAAISLPPRLLQICSEAFQGCKQLPSDLIEKLPVSDMQIAEDAFKNTPLHDQCIARHSELFLKYGVEREQYTIDGEGTLVFKEGVETITRITDADVEKIKEVVFNDGAKVIGEHAFHDCTKLPTDFIDKLPSSIIKISRYAFLDTPLREQGIERSIELLQYTLVNWGDKLVFKKGVEIIEGVEECDKDRVKAVVINDGAKVIGAGAFYGCEELTAVHLPRTVVEICSKAFANCQNLDYNFKDSLPTTVVKIASDAFECECAVPSSCR
ncbi:hypothetical protein TrST_g10343 [Triparma strigata]|uniref:Leucine-rich repeat domain-containing protein n=1 Tax=Triparma strigata TaxID=1606541 RepID=A0A9W7B4S7_9STRA|nr:hypothetical protein TrST_g10343 [Triparma strigata]